MNQLDQVHISNLSSGIAQCMELNTSTINNNGNLLDIRSCCTTFNSEAKFLSDANFSGPVNAMGLVKIGNAEVVGDMKVLGRLTLDNPVNIANFIFDLDKDALVSRFKDMPIEFLQALHVHFQDLKIMVEKELFDRT